jgi:hypothetical protein
MRKIRPTHLSPLCVEFHNINFTVFTNKEIDFQEYLKMSEEKS